MTQTSDRQRDGTRRPRLAAARARRRGARRHLDLLPLEPRCLLTNVPLSALLALQSLPGAPATLYLNFTGDAADLPGWNNAPIPAFDTDGDPTTFSPGELASITQIWGAVAEDFAPFNINVTTVRPTDWAHVERVDIGGTNAVLQGLPSEAGGVSDVGSFATSSDQHPSISFVFAAALLGQPKAVGDAVSHEAGHALGLDHQSLYDSAGHLIDFYNPGPGDGTAPIMGAS
ncbi:MAG: hypothetical protein JO244_08620, partial [Solirubrobacterales bacterium]|nr:hypothetical protein [Solirubrobacterales bacterium]